MSTDTPRPERVTLTDDECSDIVRASIAPGRVLSGRTGHDGSPPDVLLVTVERIIAARDRALREKIAGEIESVTLSDEEGDGGAELAAKWRKASAAARAFEHHFPADCLAEAAEYAESAAAREQALREEIADQIESRRVHLHAQSLSDCADGCGWFEYAARIARGGAR